MSRSCTVSKIWRALETIWVRGHSKWHHLILINQQNTTFFWCAVVSIALSCTIFVLFNVEECRDFDRSLKVNRSNTVQWIAQYSAVMILSYIISDIKRYIGRKK